MPCRNNGSERQTKTDNYEREAKKDDSECCKREDMVALNAKTTTITVKVKPINTTLNVITEKM